LLPALTGPVDVVAAPVEVDVRLPVAVEVPVTAGTEVLVALEVLPVTTETEVLVALEVLPVATELEEAELAREVELATEDELVTRLVEVATTEVVVLARDVDDEPDCAAARPARRGSKMIWR